MHSVARGTKNLETPNIWQSANGIATQLTIAYMGCALDGRMGTFVYVMSGVTDGSGIDDRMDGSDVEPSDGLHKN